MSSALTALALIAKRTASSARSEVILGSRAFSIAPIPKPGRGPPVTDPDDVVRKPDDLRRLNRTGAESIYKLGKHRSNALELVERIPPVEVDSEMAICDGGGGALGHPIEYISLKVPGAVESCKYCALRFTKKKK